jgi:septum formation protein
MTTFERDLPKAPFIYLGSQSPRRRELLQQLKVRHALLLPDEDEDAEALEERLGNESPRAYVRRVTRLKAAAGLRRIERYGLPSAPLLVGDTTVAIEQTILGKPIDVDDARSMLRRLSGRAHRVLSAVMVAHDGRIEEALSESRVRFRTLTKDDIDRYVATEEPYGKAGAYAIQGRAAAFVERISGSHSGIVGLPLFETMQLLHRFGIDPE